MTFPTPPGKSFVFSGASERVSQGGGGNQTITKATPTPITIASVTPDYDTDGYFGVRGSNGGPKAIFAGLYLITATCLCPRPGTAGVAWNFEIIVPADLAGLGAPFNSGVPSNQVWADDWSQNLVAGATAISTQQLITSRYVDLAVGDDIDLYLQWESTSPAGTVTINGMYSLTLTFLPGRP